MRVSVFPYKSAIVKVVKMFPHFFPWFYLSDKNEWWRRHYSISSLFNIKLFSTSSSSLSDGWKKSSFRLLHRNASCRKIRFSILLLLSKQKSNKNQWFSAKNVSLLLNRFEKCSLWTQNLYTATAMSDNYLLFYFIFEFEFEFSRQNYFPTLIDFEKSK